LLAAADAKAQSPLALTSYPFWLAPDNSTIVIRFLPNKDPTALQIPMVEKMQISLPFNGMVNSSDDTDQSGVVRVPSLAQWGMQDYITQKIKPLWNGGEAERALAKVYYRKVSYCMSCLVVSTPITEPPSPSGPIVVHLNKSIWDKVKAGLLEPDFEFAPWSTDGGGRDFKIVKGKQGNYASYHGSGFAYKERPLTEAQLQSIDGKLPELREQIGERPSAAVIEQIKGAFHASMAGEPFDQQAYPDLRFYPRGGPAVRVNGGGTHVQAARDAAAVDLPDAFAALQRIRANDPRSTVGEQPAD
jgi:hypothetical protein